MEWILGLFLKLFVAEMGGIFLYKYRRRLVVVCLLALSLPLAGSVEEGRSRREEGEQELEEPVGGELLVPTREAGGCEGQCYNGDCVEEEEGEGEGSEGETVKKTR